MEVEQLGIFRNIDSARLISIPTTYRERLAINEHTKAHLVLEGKTLCVYFDKKFANDKEVIHIKSMYSNGNFQVPINLFKQLNWHENCRLEVKAYSNKLITFRKA